MHRTRGRQRVTPNKTEHRTAAQLAGPCLWRQSRVTSRAEAEATQKQPSRRAVPDTHSRGQLAFPACYLTISTHSSPVMIFPQAVGSTQAPHVHSIETRQWIDGQVCFRFSFPIPTCKED